jgi:hypothetical protein
MKKKVVLAVVLLVTSLVIVSLWIYQYFLKEIHVIPLEITTSTDSSVITWSEVTLMGDVISTGSISLSGMVTSGEIAIAGTWKIDASLHCLFDICIDLTKPVIIQTDGTQIQANDPEFNPDGSVAKLQYISKFDPNILHSELIKVNITKGFAIRSINDGGSSEDTITKKWPYYLQINEVGGCAGSSKKQTILDLNGKEVDISQYEKNYPNNFSIWDFKYSYSWSSVSYSSITLYTPEQIPYTGSISIHDDVGKKIHDFAIQNKFLAKNYIIEFREIPWVKILYTSNLVPADRLVSLGTDPVWMNKNLINNELTDIVVTKKILSYYNNAGRWVTIKNSKNGYEDMITDSWVLIEQLPIFRVVPIDTTGNYLLYTTPGYEIAQFAELCKPLVYVYSSIQENNTLSVNLPSGGYFSKLIPYFSHGNSWDFSSDTIGNIDVSGKKYDYLYYSAKVPNYQWNTDGWQVAGSDMMAFFQDKLPKTGMNPREMDDFIGFWKSEFKKDKRYFVSFKFDDTIEQYAQLSFSQKPDAIHRILLEAYPMQESDHNDYYLWPRIGNGFDQKLLRSFARSGKRDVLEWGWVVFDYDKNIYIIK